jgi:hypothetical protein
MMESERELQAQKAIKEFVQKSCVFILPGAEGQKATGAGTGIIITTRGKHLAVLTAEHIAKPAIELEYRLGYFMCSNPIPNFVSGIIPFQGDVDVALLILKEELKQPLEQLAIKFEAVPTADFEVDEKDSLILNGFPWELSYYSKERSEQGFWVITYRCLLCSESLDAKGRYRVEWKDAVLWRSEKDFELPSPEGISGGPLWRFRKPHKDAIWAPGEIGKIIGIQSAWDRKGTVLIEPVSKWAAWFHESLEKIDESFV